MYKVVLIDDEAIITEGLEKVVDWSAHNCQVAALAQDAASGAQAIRTHRPDILFTDIKMPGEDGLTMLAGLKGEFPRMQIAVPRRSRSPSRTARTQTAFWSGRPRPTLRSTAPSDSPSRTWPTTATSASGTCPSCSTNT